MITICVCGSRDFKDREFFNSKLNEYLNNLGDDYAIIEGGADGADKLTREYCEENAIVYTSFNADWDTLGKAAGPIRNKYMAEACDQVIAFKLRNKKCKGTNNMIAQAKSMGKKVVVYER